MAHTLFILRDSSAPTNHYTTTATSGVGTSTRFIVEALTAAGFSVAVAGVATADEIAHVVRMHRPVKVVIETLWVNPEVFPALLAEFPDVVWMVRDHSESCFRVLEENAFGWVIDYLNMGVMVISNAKATHDFDIMARAAGANPKLVKWAPNIYPVSEHDVLPERSDDGIVRIGCFGAVRPMKNHITQALAALQFAERLGVSIHFHINGYDIPGYIDPILNNLRVMFSKLPQHQLVEHHWMSHEEFLKILSSMDICSQVSFTETFNIVAADAMTQGVPLITSKEVPWLGHYAYRDPNSSEDIASGYYDIWTESRTCRRWRLHRQRRDMKTYSENALLEWSVNIL